MPMFWTLGYFEFAIDLRQWLIGANYHEGCGYNVFFLCFRLGYNPDTLPF